MDSIDSGITRLFKLLHPENASPEICVTLLGIVIEVIPEYCTKPEGNITTPSPIVT